MSVVNWLLRPPKAIEIGGKSRSFSQRQIKQNGKIGGKRSVMGCT